MTRLKIAVYHHLHSGGAKRVMSEQAHRLAEHHHVEVFSLNTADHRFAGGRESSTVVSHTLTRRKVPSARSPLGRVNPVFWMVDLLQLDWLARSTAKLIDRKQFDVVLVHPCQVTQSPLVLRWLQTPTLYYCHELPRGLYERKRYYRPPIVESGHRNVLGRVDPLPGLWRAIVRNADFHAARHASRILVNSKFTQSRVEATYHRQVDVCYPGVDSAKDMTKPTHRENFVLSVGALTPNKGFDFVIRALGSLPANQRPSLVIVSNYQELNELAYLNSLASLQNVSTQFLAGITDQELWSWYGRAGCVAYAPIDEPFGLVALEAMSAGSPIVGVAEGGLLETVQDGITGLLVHRKVEELGSAIQRLLTDKRLARHLSCRAREMVSSTFSWERHIQCLETSLQDVVQRRVL